MLREGTYSGDFIVTRSGTEGNPVVFQAADGERVIIDGSMTINGAHTTWQGIEFTYSGWTTRETAIAGSSPADIPNKNLYLYGAGTRLINCHIHDLRELGAWEAASGTLLYGNLVTHLGWLGPDRPHGHGIYMQNQGAEKLLKHNAFIAPFGWGVHAYGSAETHLENLTLIENAFALAGGIAPELLPNILIGGYVVAVAPQLYRNNTYGGGSSNIGYDAGATGVVLEDNYLPDGLTKVNCTITSETGNVTEAPASGTRVTVYANEYETGRALITIYNWDEADSIVVDVSDVLDSGAAYALHNTQDYYGDIATGTVAGDGTITVDMRAVSHSVAAVAGDWPSEATVFPTFGCFIIRAA